MKLNVKLIKSEMLNRCLTFRALAKNTGLSEATLHRIVNSGGGVRIPTVGKLAKGLGLNPQDILLQE